MSESHSLTVLKRTMEDVQRYLDAEVRGEPPSAAALHDGHSIVLAHGLNRALGRMNLHVSRATVHDEAMRQAERGYNPVDKYIAVGTVVQLQADLSAFDAVYDGLSNENSRQVFDWFISYRTALAFVGMNADRVVPGRMSTTDWEISLEQAGKTFAGGAYHIDGIAVDSGLAEVAATFFLEQYRLKGIVEPKVGDVVLDCGAYRGETALWFALQAGRGGRVVAFEPVAHNLEILQRNLVTNGSADLAPITAVASAVSGLTGVLHFSLRAGGGSRVDTTAAASVSAVTIDDAVEQQHLGRVDFIKMDIEGGEVDALIGADKTLSRFTPKLAISVYHRPRDLPDIFALVRKASSAYRMYLSHKSPGLSETVLFACVSTPNGSRSK